MQEVDYFVPEDANIRRVEAGVGLASFVEASKLSNVCMRHSFRNSVTVHDCKSLVDRAWIERRGEEEGGGWSESVVNASPRDR